MKRGEVWWVEFDPSIGSEVRKTRPAVIVSNDSANRHLSRVIVVPMTSNVSRVYPGETIVSLGDRRSKAVADQIMTADKSRLKERIGVLSRVEMVSVEDAMRVQLALSK